MRLFGSRGPDRAPELDFPEILDGPDPSEQQETTESSLKNARDELSNIDKNLAYALSSFTDANLKTSPTTEMVAKVKFPDVIYKLAFDKGVPPELFAGVSLFLSLEIRADSITSLDRKRNTHNKLEEFKVVCDLLCQRHEVSRKVFEYKKENPNADDVRKDETGKVVTFDQKQHDAVVERMWGYSNQIMLERDGRVLSDGHLSTAVIDWVAAVNAGWQDMGIHENKGPFIEPVTANSNFEIRDPRPAFAA